MIINLKQGINSAHDSINRIQLIIAMKQFKIPGKLTRLFKARMENSMGQVRPIRIISDKEWS